MRVNIFSRLLAMALLIASGSVAAQAIDEVTFNDPYVRGVPPGQPNSAAFMQIVNKGSSDHALVSGSSPASEEVELHTHTMEGGMMRMRQVEKIELPAGQTVSLQPGGLHVMLIGLKQELAPGEEVELTLIFEDGSEVTMKAPVRKLQMKMKPMEHGKMSH
jgi:copper(I)-binding protein